MSLVKDFANFTKEDFEKAFQKEVKNGDFRELLTWHTEEGISVEPFYYPGENKNIKLSGRANEWEIDQEIIIADYKKANENALFALSHGASSITFNGKINSIDDFRILAKDISIEFIEVNFKNTNENIVQFYKAYADEKNIGLDKLRGCFYLDNANLKDFPNMRLGLDATKYRNAGSTLTQELAFSIGEAKEIIEKNEHLNSIQLELAVGPNYFFEIAKFRAIRILWANICKAYGRNISLFLKGTNGRIWLAAEDETNNLIRQTFQAASSILGGCDSVYLSSYDRKETKNSARLSTNIQLVLKEESFLNKVFDASSGAYYVEKITEQLAENAWKLFQDVEGRGGYSASLKDEFIQKQIYASAVRLKERIANNEIQIIGVNKYRSDKKEREFKRVLDYSKEWREIDLFE